MSSSDAASRDRSRDRAQRHNRPHSRMARPPSYISESGSTSLPTTPRRTYHRESSRIRDTSPTPTYFSYTGPQTRSPEHARSDVRIGRPVARRLSDMETPVLTPTAPRASSSSPNRLIGARALPVAPVDRSNSPDTTIRIPLMPEKAGWVDEVSYEQATKSPVVRAYSIGSYDDEDTRSIAPSLTETIDSFDKESTYGPVPTLPQARRNAAQKTTEVVKLTDGNLVIDCAIPDKLRSLLSRHDSREFTHLKYTACTTDPDDFGREGFTLRQVGLGRETELLITLTMYNEDEQLFTRTLHGVVKNIAHLCSRARSRTWGPQGWKKVVVCIVADGRRNVHPRVLDVLAAIGVYQEGLAQNKVDGRPVTAHIFEYTSQYSITSDLQFRGSEKGIPPIQLLFCLKEQNAKKLNSHRWMFNAFAPLLNPNVCVLLDVGTRPGSDSIYHLWKTFDLNSNVAGAAGEIKILKGKGWSALLNPLVASQNFEYKMSNILDKPFQSVLGYISVLPGAFSAYRYVALAPDDFGRGPLDSYFKGEKVDMGADVFEKNMYLAEDRILCWELVARKDRKWLLKYVSEAWGETDCPDTVAELIGQRRRWLNGATFAATFALWNFRQIWHTSHSKSRKFFLHIEFAYQAVELLFTFFGLANFYLTFYFITQSFGLEYHWASYLFVILRYLCIMVTAAQFILALGNRPKGARALFMTSLIVYAFIMAYTLFCALFLGIKSITTSIEQGQSVFSDKKFANVVVSGIATSGVYFISSLMYLEPWHCFTSFGQYMILLPFYLCTLTIFAFCNIHDLSWGTKEDATPDTDLGDAVKSGNSDKVKVEILSAPDVDGAYEDALTNLRIRKPVPDKPADMSKVQEDYFKEIRSRVVLIWLVCNLTMMMAISEYYKDGSGSNAYLSIIMYSVVLMTSIRFAGSIVYLAMHFVQSIGVRKSASSQVMAGVEVLKKKSKGLKFWSKELPSTGKA